MKWKTLESTYISKHPYFTARKDKCQMPDEKIVEEYFVVELPISACALAITDDGNAIMIKQYRHAIGESIIEIPGGFIDAGEDTQQAIARELLEETGYQFSSIQYVGKVAANPGVLDSYTMLYLAQGGKKISSQHLDHNEEIEIILLPLDKLRTMLNNNEIVQALHTSCLLYGFKKLDEKH